MNHFRKLNLKFNIYARLKGANFKLPKNKPRCLIFLAADYGNLGDVAITYAQKKYLKDHFPNYDIIEIPAAETLTAIRSIKHQIQYEDIITVIGGGNMGDMYGDIELLRLMVVRTFKNNRIILFPQTIDYNNSADANWLKRLSQKIYSSHPRLTMTAREHVSYETMKCLYPTVDVRLVPDIVMGLDEKDNVQREDIVTICLRNDKEKADNTKIVESILDECANRQLKHVFYDTHMGGDRYTESQKYEELRKIWDQFRKSKFVITDRLHGMIFAFITGTPAIVLPNSNFKVEGSYQWICNCGYIQMISRVNQELTEESILKTPHSLSPSLHERLNHILDRIIV